MPVTCKCDSIPARGVGPGALSWQGGSISLTPLCPVEGIASVGAFGKLQSRVETQGMGKA